MNKIIIPIRGMHCASCELLVEEQLKKLPGVESVRVSQKRAMAEVQLNGLSPSEAVFTQAVQAAGYEVGEKEKLPWFSRASADYKDLAWAGIILLIIYLVAKWLNLFELNVGNQSTGVAVALLVGLVAGVSTCMALVGGLVLGFSARHAELHPEATPGQKFRPHLYFNLGRIIGFALLGGLIGLIGKAFSPSANILGFLTIVIGGVMIFLGLKLVGIFPVLKDKNITLPSGLSRWLGLDKETKEYSHKGVLVMGALTFFLPCGFTQAMQLFAVSTGSFWQGAAIMGLFAIGTAPGLLGIGTLTSFFKGKKARLVFMTAGLAVIAFGWFNIANGGNLLGGGSDNSVVVASDQDAQEVRMTQSAGGYSPNTFTVEKGRPVKWIINSTSPFSCASSIVMRKYGISQSLKAGENIITFTPNEIGEISFSCSMGMYRGKFIVVEAKETSPATVSTDTSFNSSSSCSVSGSGCGGCGGGSVSNQIDQEGIVETTLVEQTIKTVYTYGKDIAPNTFTVKKGQPVRFEVEVQDNGFGCMSTIMVPGLWNTAELLKKGQTIVMEFTPQKTGDYEITCAMGVPRGLIKVIE